jgi:DNA-binding MarR family transcriptional regulator
MNATITDSPPMREVAFLNARAAALGARRANEALAPLGLKVRSYSVLSLAAGEVAPSQRELADYLQLDPSQIVALVDDLEQRGWVSREPGTDRRVKVIVATPEGERMRAQAARATAVAEDSALGMLDAEERTRLVAILQKVAFGG